MPRKPVGAGKAALSDAADAMNPKDGSASVSVPSEVGYGRPPMGHRFQPGVSGNPGGKKKGTPNLDTLIARELDEKVEVRDNGVVKKLTKREVGVKAMVNKAVQADIKAWGIIFEREIAEVEEDALGEQEKQALYAYLKRSFGDGDGDGDGAGESGEGEGAATVRGNSRANRGRKGAGQ